MKFENEISPLLRGELLNEDLSGLDVENTALFYVLVELLQKKLKNRRECIRDELLGAAEQFGQGTDKGGFRLITENQIEVLKEKRESQLPNPDDLMEFLKSKKIPISSVFDTVNVVELNESKLEYLINTGKIKRGDVDKLKKESVALKVRPSPPLKGELSDLESDASKKYQTRTNKQSFRKKGSR